MADPGDGQEDFPTRTTNSLSTTYDEHLHRILTTAWIQHKNRDKTGVPTERTLKSLLSLIGFGRLETIRAWFEERVDMEQRAKLYKEGKVPDSQQTRCGEKRERNDSGHSSEGSSNSVASKTNKISLEQQARSSPNPSATNPSAIHPSAIHPSSSTSSFSFSSSTTPYPPPSPTASPQLTSSQHSPKRSSTLDAIRATYPPLVCPGCHKTFPNRNQVKDHVRDHHHGHFVYRCIVPECDHALESLCGLENHLRSSHDKRDITSAPTLPIPPSRSSLPPKKRHFSSSPSPCPTASQDDLLVASTRTTFRPRLPYGTAHPDGPIPPPRLPSPDTALALATDEHWCPVCRRQLTSNRGVDRHLRERHPFVRPFRCPIRGCGGEFASLGSRADHLRKRHVRAGKNNDDDGMVDADIHADADGMDVDNGYGLLTEGKLSPFPHYDSYDHDSDARLLSTDDGDDGNDRQRETAYVLASRLFRCPLCPESPSLTSKAQVDTHIREKHRGARPFGCAAKGCASKFSSLLARRNHVITKHQGVERENEAVEGSEGEGNEVESAQQEARYDADESEDDDDDCPNPAETPARRDSHPTPLSCSPTSSSTPSPTSQGCGPPHRRARYVCPVTGCDTRFRGNKALGAHLHVVHQEGISELDPESSDDGRGPEKKQRSLLVTVRMSGRRDRRRCAESPVLCDRRHSSPILKDRARSNRRSGSLCVEYRMPPPARVAVKCLRACGRANRHVAGKHGGQVPVPCARVRVEAGEEVGEVGLYIFWGRGEGEGVGFWGASSVHGFSLHLLSFFFALFILFGRVGRGLVEVSMSLTFLVYSRPTPRSDIVRHLRHTHQLEILEGDEVSTKSIGVSDGPVDSVPSGMDVGILLV
ncbi:hypothetical protein BC938DRAFT_480244 [Jimgerdemannia flammicorona]|uniref:C2H2-type domain-containing protein n=1 Tax=Jimgerdemannia flammicorona TaxID=994334 RepID=A0A433QJ08_9FUNG|nr:hypothetical protein BC938DRAFT_480244 [Jimgerdemannia flammicorona]